MTPKEFQEIKEKFDKEELRWQSLKVGQHVYECFPRYFDMEYFEIEITSINIEERFIEGLDYSQNNKKVKLYGFSTEEELAKEGITFVKKQTA